MPPLAGAVGAADWGVAQPHASTTLSLASRASSRQREHATRASHTAMGDPQDHPSRGGACQNRCNRVLVPPGWKSACPRRRGLSAQPTGGGPTARIDHPQSRYASQLPPAGVCDARFAHCHGRSSGPPIQREHAKFDATEFFAPSSQVQHAPAGGGCRRSRLGVVRRYCIDHPQSRFASQLPPAGACQIQCRGISCPWPFTAPPSAFATAGLAPLGLGIGSGARPILASPYARRRREAHRASLKG